MSTSLSLSNGQFGALRWEVLDLIQCWVRQPTTQHVSLAEFIESLYGCPWIFNPQTGLSPGMRFWNW